MDRRTAGRNNDLVSRAGALRRQLARTLNAAYADGLLSQDTFVRRVDQVLKAQLIDPFRIIGDLNLRRPGRTSPIDLAGAIISTLRRTRIARDPAHEGQHLLLALDWNGGERELVLGRHSSCDVVLPDPTVSRHHARLVFRDGAWILQDLQSTNGTIVNGERVGRCELRPGDRLVLGDEALQVD